MLLAEPGESERMDSAVEGETTADEGPPDTPAVIKEALVRHLVAISTSHSLLKHQTNEVAKLYVHRTHDSVTHVNCNLQSYWYPDRL